MNEIGSNEQPLIPQGWQRSLVFIPALVLSMLIGSSLGTFLYLSLPFADQSLAQSSLLSDPYFLLVSQTTVFLINLVVVWIFRKKIDNQSFQSLGFQWTRYGSDFAFGIGLGILLPLMALVLLRYMDVLYIKSFAFEWPRIIIGFFMLISVALNEELIIRGYLLKNLMRSLQNWMALLITSVIFTIMHSWNPDISWIGVLNIFLAGLLMGVYYIKKQNLWFPIAFHLSWNFFQGPVFGFKVSGLPLQGILNHVLNGPTYLTGGNFGLEGSIISVVFLSLAVVGVYFYYQDEDNISGRAF
ncbi:MAG: CPBP family intramembrane metalloprotease [Bacteroidetes bacterium SW_10_40_5]|nr:MAG: CPBP family intramembrane metalloprotease [Bacteroidetes bacterium SW_10_40_5]